MFYTLELCKRVQRPHFTSTPMSQSKHFLNTNSRKTRSSIKAECSGTFHADIERFDTELKSTLSKEIPSTATKSTRIRTIKHIKLEGDHEIRDSVPETPKIPDSFFPMYNKIKEMREMITTPVDLIGCVRIPALLRLITLKFKEKGTIETIEITEIPGYKPQLKAIEGDDSNIDKIWRFQLLVTLLFSSQTKDEVNFQVMQSLHHHYLSLGYQDGLCIPAVLSTSFAELDELIYKVGFHSRKASYLLETAKVLNDSYNQDVPDNIEELVKLKGIGYKMGHLILQGAWKKVIGISVDTHMVRLCNMFGWLPKHEKNPDNVRKELEKMLVNHRDLWSEINPVLVGFGQSVCTPTGRRCDLCLLSKIDKKNDYLCPAVDKRLLLRVQRDVETYDRKVRGDLEKLIKYINS